MSPNDEANLVERIASGDELAFDEVYRRYRLRIYGFSFRMTFNQALAEDITHESFLVLIKNPERFRAERGSLLTYMCAVARNLVMNHLRRKRNGDVRFNELENFDTPESGNDPLAELLNHELRSLIEGCIADLPPAQREVIVLREFEGLSYEEIASITEADLGAVKTRLHRARRTLAKSLEVYITTATQEDKRYELH